MVFLTRGEFDTFLAGVAEFYRPLVQTMAYTGLRWSEATALRVRDVDILGHRIHVVQAWKRTPDSYFEIGEPKSRRSRRTITIPPDLAEQLIPLTPRPGDEYLFVSRQGRPVRHSNFRYRVWLPAVEKLKAAKVDKTPRIHDLRHSHASWLIAAGVPLPAIQRRLGHESITTTIDRYGHLAPEMDDTIVAALAQPADALEPVR
jgi:integrase